MTARAQIVNRGRAVPGAEYELVNFTVDAEYALRDGGGDVLVYEPAGEHEWVEVACERCGRFAQHVSPSITGSGRWTCHANDSTEACGA
jgi:hypothetical protein